ncbi:unnamed protein product [Trichobilharzia szidati]|nr:unnamed protein product [Trichobilharzia szidati]
MQLSKKSKVNLMRNVKLSTSRDFRINQATLVATLEQSAAAPLSVSSLSDIDGDDDDENNVDNQPVNSVHPVEDGTESEDANPEVDEHPHGDVDDDDEEEEEEGEEEEDVEEEEAVDGEEEEEDESGEDESSEADSDVHNEDGDDSGNDDDGGIVEDDIDPAALLLSAQNDEDIENMSSSTPSNSASKSRTETPLLLRRVNPVSQRNSAMKRTLKSITNEIDISAKAKIRRP